MANRNEAKEGHNTASQGPAGRQGITKPIAQRSLGRIPPGEPPPSRFNLAYRFPGPSRFFLDKPWRAPFFACVRAAAAFAGHALHGLEGPRPQIRFGE